MVLNMTLQTLLNPIALSLRGLTRGLCSFARCNGYDCVIAVESEEKDWFDIRNPSLHAFYDG